MNEQDFQLLQILIERGSYMNTYWNFFILVSSAVLGILASGHEFTQSRALKFLLLLAFVVFAASNLDAILNLTEQRNILLKKLAGNIPQEIKETVTPKSKSIYLIFHLIFDALVIGCILFVPWHRLNLAKAK